MAAEEAKGVKEKDPIQLQNEVLLAAELEKEKKKETRIKWYKERILKREVNSKIVDVYVSGPKLKVDDPEKIFVEIVREMGYIEKIKLSLLHKYGLAEWMEMMGLLKKIKTRYKITVYNYIVTLIKKLTTIRKSYDLPTDPAEVELLKKIEECSYSTRGTSGSKAKKSYYQIVSEERNVLPDLSNLNLSIPTPYPQKEGTVILEPEFGVFFEDWFRNYRFFRASEIPIAHTGFLKVIIALVPYTDYALPMYRAITAELEKRNQG